MEKQNEEKNINIILYVVLSSIITALIIGGGVYLWQNSSVKITRSRLNAAITSNNNCPKKTENSDVSKKKLPSQENFILENLSKDVQKRDDGIILIPNEGFFINSSILSNNRDKIVYSELSKSVINSWDFEHKIFVKDLNTNIVNEIYSFNTKGPFSYKNIFINEAHAGGCSITYFPVGWSKNDKKIILEWGNPTSCGSGGAPDYGTFTLNVDGGDISALATYNPIFLDGYSSKVLFVEESDNSPLECSPFESNLGAIVIKDIESGEEKILINEKNSSYILENLNENGYLSYLVKKVINNNGCSELDNSVPEKILKININDFK